MNDPQYSSAPPPGSPNIILAIVSAALGALGLLFMIPTLLFTPCGIISFGLGVGSVITGLLARSRAKADPVHWGGAGLAIGGVLAGAVSVIAPIAYIIIVAILMFGIMAIGHAGK